MTSTLTTDDHSLERQLREINEALLLSAVQQHELLEQVEQANAAARESERQFRAMIDALPAAIYTTDAAGRLTHFNPAAALAAGRTPELGKDEWCVSWKLFRPDGTPLSAADCPMAVAIRESRDLRGQEVIIERPDGTRTWAEVSPTLLRDTEGQVVGGMNMIVDITDRKQGDEALRASHARFEAIFDTSPVGMYLVDAQLRIRQMSLNARPIFGDIAELIGGDFVEVIHILWPPKVADDIVARFRHTLATGQMYVAPEFSEVRRDRQLREYYDWQIHRITLPDGQYSAVCYFVDTSARVHAEAARRDSEVRYRRLFESAKDGILILDAAHGNVSEANPFMSELLGYSHDEFSGKELWEIGLFRDKSASEAAVRELQDKGYLRYDHLPLETNHGRQVEVEVVANAYREGGHSVIQCNIRDITERSRLEKQMQEQAESLADLHRRKDEFLAMLSHELRNPLAPISNAVQLLRLQKNEDQLQQQARTIIERQVGQLTRLVDDLLEVSRITTGRIHLHLERVALNGIVENAVETVRPLIGQRRHVLKVSLPPQLIWLDADATRLEQVVVNLLTNAAKYTEDGGHILLLVQQEGDEAVLRVRDTGVGIAPNLLPRIFELFTQAERSLDRSQGGLGIGLCLVKQLVEMHRGKVEVYSALGQGSEFAVRLPAASLSSPPPLPAAIEPEPAGPVLRVLVVDDNIDASQSLGMLLVAAGHDVRMAYDGPSALEAALDYRPQVMLLDIGLPEMNGLEVAQRLRQQPTLEGVVLIAMTGYGDEADRQRSKAAGFDHHLVKPADFKKVQQILATVTEKPGS